MIPDFISIYSISLSYVQESITAPFLIMLTTYGVPLTVFLIFRKAYPFRSIHIFSYSICKYTSFTPASFHQIIGALPQIHLILAVLIQEQKVINIEYNIRISSNITEPVTNKPHNLVLVLIIGQLHLYVLLALTHNNRTHIENLLHGRLTATNPVQIVQDIFIQMQEEDVSQVTHYILV